MLHRLLCVHVDLRTRLASKTRTMSQLVMLMEEMEKRYFLSNTSSSYREQLRKNMNDMVEEASAHHHHHHLLDHHHQHQHQHQDGQGLHVTMQAHPIAPSSTSSVAVFSQSWYRRHRSGEEERS
jgi:cysteine sulfinate desulfinase/cysteine desulfurase-like protein